MGLQRGLNPTLRLCRSPGSVCGPTVWPRWRTPRSLQVGGRQFSTRIVASHLQPTLVLRRNVAARGEPRSMQKGPNAKPHNCPQTAAPSAKIGLSAHLSLVSKPAAPGFRVMPRSPCAPASGRLARETEALLSGARGPSALGAGLCAAPKPICRCCQARAAASSACAAAPRRACWRPPSPPAMLWRPPAPPRCRPSHAPSVWGLTHRTLWGPTLRWRAGGKRGQASANTCQCATH